MFQVIKGAFDIVALRVQSLTGQVGFAQTAMLGLSAFSIGTAAAHFLVIYFNPAQHYVYVFIKYLSWTVSTVVVIPLANAVAVWADCRMLNGVSYSMANYPATACFDGKHIPQLLIGLVGLLVAQQQAVVWGLFDNDFRNSTESLFKKFKAQNLVLSIAAGKLMTTLSVLTKDRVFINEYFFVNFLIIMAVFLRLANTPVFFNQKLMKLVLFFWSALTVGSVGLLFENVFPTGSALLWFGLALFTLAVYLASIELKCFAPLNSHVLVLNDEEQRRFHIEAASLMLKQSLEDGDPAPLMRLVYKHRTLCFKVDCPLKSVVSMEAVRQNPAELEDGIIKSMKGYINLIFIQAIADFPAAMSYKLGYCLFLVEFQKQFNMAFEYMSRFTQGQTLSLQEQFLVHVIREVLGEQNASAERESVISIETDVSQRQSFNSEFQALVEKLTYLSLDFWENVKQDQVDYRKMVNLNSAFLREDRRLRARAEHPHISSKTDLKLYFVYARFLSLILGEEAVANSLVSELLAKLKELNDIQNTELNIGSHTNLAELFFPSLLIDVTNKQKPEVIKINVEMETLLGYNPHELPRVSIDAVIPEAFREPHEHIMTRYLKQIDRKNKYRKKFILPLTKNGNIVPMVANTKYIESPSNGAAYIFCAIITDAAFDNSFYFLIDSKLNITNVSANCAAEFGMMVSHLQKSPQLKHWFRDPPDLFTDWKSDSFVVNLVARNPKTGSFDKDKGTKYHVETIVWDFTDISDFKSLVVKLDRVSADMPEDQPMAFRMDEIGSFKLRDKTMEKHLLAAQSSANSRLNVGHLQIPEGQATIVGTAGDDEWFDQYFFKNIKLLKMRKNRLYEIDFTQIDNLEDKEVLNDEFEQFVIDSKGGAATISETDQLKEGNRPPKFDFSHPRKFRRFVELYHRAFRVSRLALFLFVTVAVFVAFALGGIKYDAVCRDAQGILENVSVAIMLRLDNVLLLAQDIQVASILSARGLASEKSDLSAVAQRMRDRISNVRNSSAFIVQNQDLFNPNVTVPVTQNGTDTSFYNFYVLEQWLLAKLNALTNPNLSPEDFRAALTSNNNLTSFVLFNSLSGYLQGSVALMNAAVDSKAAFSANTSVLNIVLDQPPIILVLLFILVYFYFLYRVNAKNLKLLTIFLQVPDALIEEQIARIQRLLVIIKRVLYEEKIPETGDQRAALPRTKTIYRKKLFKNHKDWCSLRIALLILVPVLLIGAFTGTKLAVNMVYEGAANNIVANGYVPSYEYKALADFGGLLSSYLSIPTNASLVASDGFNLTSTTNLFFYQYVRGTPSYTPNYRNCFSQAYFGDACQIGSIYADNDTAQSCLSRYAVFGNPGVATTFNIMQYTFYEMRNGSNSGAAGNSALYQLSELSCLKRRVDRSRLGPDDVLAQLGLPQRDSPAALAAVRRSRGLQSVLFGRLLGLLLPVQGSRLPEAASGGWLTRRTWFRTQSTSSRSSRSSRRRSS